MLSGRESSSTFRAERCDSHCTSFVSIELREWAGVRGIGLLIVPGEFHGLTADLENLIRVITRLARKLADDHPSLTFASCVSLACFSHNNGFKTGGYSPVQWAFGADKEEHGFTTTMPSEIETFRMSAMNRTGERCHQSRPTHDSQGKRWTNWCCLVIARKQVDQMSSYSAPSMQ